MQYVYLLIRQLKLLYTVGTHCVYTVKCKCVVKPLLIDRAINKGKALLGVELHFPFNLPFHFRKRILTTLHHYTTVISSSSSKMVDGRKKVLVGASSAAAAYKRWT